MNTINFSSTNENADLIVQDFISSSNVNGSCKPDWNVESWGKSVEKGSSSGSSISLVEISVTITSSIGLNLVASLIYDLMKDKAKKLWVNGSVSELSKEAVAQKLKVEE